MTAAAGSGIVVVLVVVALIGVGAWLLVRNARSKRSDSGR